MNKIFDKQNKKARLLLPVVSFNPEHEAIEIVTKQCHFLLSPLPSMKGSFGAAKWMTEKKQGWVLPSASEMEVINDNLSEINDLLLANDYPQIREEEEWWIDESYITTSLLEMSWAKSFPLNWKHVSKCRIDSSHEFRLVKRLEDEKFEK